MKWSFALLGAAAAMAAASNAVQAADVKIDYVPLELNYQSGVIKLYARITRAAKQVCKPAHIVVWRSAAQQECEWQAVAQGVRQIDAPRLTAYWEFQTGGNGVIRLSGPDEKQGERR